MKKIYFLLLLVTLTCFTNQFMVAQSYANNPSTKTNIEGLSIYPNPVNSERPIINIASKLSLVKQIEIFDVLGKQVFNTILYSKELNISSLRKGVYILKITENNVSESRKLIIR
ncbi:T9SS type A sorting domain-containing protein [uncultured Algibacter sp.]|uniref:T9SS type A sorting domain-containing protein n=1 Tax=uncultured Algibacter sp. TaxID=298659 RepID=UPI0026112860|nr:T9SS type A sorting domain-containing protein [uncultured Algibacter sp.]